MTREEFKSYLEKVSDRPCSLDPYDPDKSHIYDMCGGNMDDAYDAGLSDGMILAAREILDLWNKVEE